MNKLFVAIATSLTFAASASAAPMYIQLPDNSYDENRSIGVADADTRTATFLEFGFNNLVATSFYDFTDASIFGSFFDTNIPAILTANGLPASGTALDGIDSVDLILPDCPLGQCDIDALSPLVPPLGTNNEGFLQTWDLQVEYYFSGILDPGGPTFTSGFFNVYFNDLNDNTNDRLVLSGSLSGSDVELTNLDLFFELTFAEPGFLWVQDSTGTFRDASTRRTTLKLDTNVDPPIPTTDQLLLVGDYVVRQTSLDGSVTAQIPEPATLALLGVALLGLGISSRRRRLL